MIRKNHMLMHNEIYSTTYLIRRILLPPSQPVNTTTTTTNGPRVTCFLQYCNGDACLRKSLCGGVCTSKTHAIWCESHWYTVGERQGRQLQNNTACVNLPDTTTTTSTTTTSTSTSTSTSTTTLITMADLIKSQQNLKVGARYL